MKRSPPGDHSNHFFSGFATVAPPTSGSWYEHGLLSPETLERYRRITPVERLALTFEMIRENTPYLLAGKPDVVDRRFELLVTPRKAAATMAKRSPSRPTHTCAVFGSWPAGL